MHQCWLEGCPITCPTAVGPVPLAYLAVNCGRVLMLADQEEPGP